MYDIVCTSEWPSLLVADITDCTTSPTNKPVHNVSGPGKVFGGKEKFVENLVTLSR